MNSKYIDNVHKLAQVHKNDEPFLFLFVWVDAIRPRSTAEVMSGRSK